MKSKIILLVLSSLAVVALVIACGKSGDSGPAALTITGALR